jgi:hypothetical protein
MIKEKQLTGLERQDAFLTQLHSQPLFCPSCRGKHSYIELRGGNDWRKNSGDIFCPNTKEQLTHGMALFGGECYLAVKEML